MSLDEAIASRAVFVIISGSDGRTDGRRPCYCHRVRPSAGVDVVVRHKVMQSFSSRKV